MNGSKPTISASTTVYILLALYLAGYAVIRLNCKSFGTTVVVPTYVCSNTLGEKTPIYWTYKPLFFAERQLAGHQFTWSMWAMPSL